MRDIAEPIPYWWLADYLRTFEGGVDVGDTWGI